VTQHCGCNIDTTDGGDWSWAIQVNHKHILEEKYLGERREPNEPFMDSKSRYIVLGYFSRNSPVDRAREVFKLSTDSTRLLVLTEQNFSVWGFLGGGPEVEVLLRFFGQLYPALGSNFLAQGCYGN